MNSSTVGVILARMESERLPGKVIEEIAGRPLIMHIVDRMKFSRCLDKVVVATTVNKADDRLVKVLTEGNVEYYRGSSDNVLERLIRAAAKFAGDLQNVDRDFIVVKITGDNPLTDPEEIDRGIEHMRNGGYDLVISQGLPVGCSAGIFRFSALNKSSLLSQSDVLKEHPGLAFHHNPDLFRISIITCEKKKFGPRVRLTVDEKEDLELMRAIYRRLYKKGSYVKVEEVLELLSNDQYLAEMNCHVRQREY